MTPEEAWGRLLLGPEADVVLEDLETRYFRSQAPYLDVPAGVDVAAFVLGAQSTVLLLREKRAEIQQTEWESDDG